MMVLALALVHWVYSCTADFGSLGAVVEWLSRLTRYALGSSSGSHPRISRSLLLAWAYVI